MGRKYLKIITSCLSLLTLAPFTACSISSKQEDKLQSIEIISDFNDLRLEVNETYSSNPIEIKCFDSNKKEIKDNTELFLYSLTENQMDISIQNNQIHIGTNKSVGLHKYKIIAKSSDGSVYSEPKDLNIDVYKQKILPDSIELSGIEQKSLYTPTDESIDYQLIAKAKSEVIDDYDPKCNYEINIKSSDSNKTQDLFNNPLFKLEQQDKQFKFNISKDIDNTYNGKYNIEIKVSLCSNPSVNFIKPLQLNLTYGLTYFNLQTHYNYERKDVNSDWYLKSISCDEMFINKDKLESKIYEHNVTGIGSNFCGFSTAKQFIDCNLPSTIISIGEYAFYKQEALSNLYIKDVQYIGQYAFANCPMAMINPTWHFKFKQIDQYAFANCIQFEPKYFDDIEILGESSLRSIKSSEIHLGPNIKTIGAEAMFDCPNLLNVYINASNPPELTGPFIGGICPSSIKIHVPINAIQNYLNAPNWAIYQQNLVGDITM